jgi:hypothetical protein
VWKNEKRFKTYSYQELMSKIEEIKKDKNRKVIFLGASSMWGARGIDRAQDTIPWQFAERTRQGVSVYNLSYPSMRPLDAFIITYLLKDDAHLFVVDISSAYFKKEYTRGVKEDYSKYIRIQRLLLNHQEDFLKHYPEVLACLQTYDVVPRRELYFDSARFIPLMRYKEEINYWLFGKHFSLFINDIVTGIIEIFKPSAEKTTQWNALFKPPKDLPPDKRLLKPNPFETEKFESSLNECIARQYDVFITNQHIPVVMYISPHSPELTQQERSNPVYDQNIQFIKNVYKGSTLFDLDTTNTLREEEYVDEIHFTVEGHKKLADLLYRKIKDTRLFDGFLK